MNFQDEKLTPIKTNERDTPISIFKNELLIVECNSIQEAARWLKEHTKDSCKRYTVIQNGYVFGHVYKYKGDTYQFVSDKNSAIRRRKELTGR